MQVLARNGKMRRSSLKIYNFGIPAFMSRDGQRICVNAGQCAGGCYARQGTFVFSSVKSAYEQRLALTRLQSFPEIVSMEIETVGPDTVRIHDSGDFYSAEYFQKWLTIARHNPAVRFYAYTKMISMTRAFELPENLTLIYSFGGREDRLIDPARDRHSRVFDSLSSLTAARYVDASADDAVAFGPCPRIGLIYHGAEARRFSA